MFKLITTVMAIFTEIYSFRLNVVLDRKCHMGQFLIQLKIEFITKICVC